MRWVPKCGVSQGSQPGGAVPGNALWGLWAGSVGWLPLLGSEVYDKADSSAVGERQAS